MSNVEMRLKEKSEEGEMERRRKGQRFSITADYWSINNSFVIHSNCLYLITLNTPTHTDRGEPPDARWGRGMRRGEEEEESRVDQPRARDDIFYKWT